MITEDKAIKLELAIERLNQQLKNIDNELKIIKSIQHDVRKESNKDFRFMAALVFAMFVIPHVLSHI